MNATDLIQLIRLDIEKIKSAGETSVSIANLETLLSAAESEVEGGTSFMAAAVIKHAELLHQSNLASYSAQSASGLELFKSVIEMAKTTVTSLILINGGSAVALLAFIGHLASAENPLTPISSFAKPLLYFVAGVFAAAFFGGLILLTQKLYTERWPGCAKAASWISVLFALGSFAAFGAGSYFGYKVFAGMPTEDRPRPVEDFENLAAIRRCPAVTKPSKSRLESSMIVATPARCGEVTISRSD